MKTDKRPVDLRDSKTLGHCYKHKLPFVIQALSCKESKIRLGLILLKRKGGGLHCTKSEQARFKRWSKHFSSPDTAHITMEEFKFVKAGKGEVHS